MKTAVTPLLSPLLLISRNVIDWQESPLRHFNLGEALAGYE